MPLRSAQAVARQHQARHIGLVTAVIPLPGEHLLSLSLLIIPASRILTTAAWVMPRSLHDQEQFLQHFLHVIGLLREGRQTERP